jgi:hypothetical protein
MSRRKLIRVPLMLGRNTFASPLNQLLNGMLTLEGHVFVEVLLRPESCEQFLWLRQLCFHGAENLNGSVFGEKYLLEINAAIIGIAFVEF